ncbi:MAG: hypothetical protein ABIJ03_03310 [Patescibacteria group bacterium]|nr:hypothetical protein [Patescibacteria group bacterium]
MGSAIVISFWRVLDQVSGELVIYLPRLLGSLIVLVVGTYLARAIRKLLDKVLSVMKLNKLAEKTPVEHFLKSSEIGSRIEGVLSTVAYWLMMLVVLQTAVGVLGLGSLTRIIEQLLGYIPRIFSALLVFVLGILAAGFLESVVKSSLKSVSAPRARMVAKVTSYSVMVLASLMAISELGIAQEFILILFVGFVASSALGIGLALGLGGQGLVKKMLDEWYKQVRED